MFCPTCSHTMNVLTRAGDMCCYFCPRCGTSVVRIDSTPSRNYPDRVYTPQLVARCRDFLPNVRSESTVRGTVRVSEVHDIWRQLGIAEAIHTPEDRK